MIKNRVSSKYLVASLLLVCILLQGMAPPAQAASSREIGIATGATLLRMKDAQLNQRLADIEHLGVTWLRVDFNWTAIQPSNAKTYNWKMYDKLVRVAGARNLKILGVLGYTPKWAQEPRCAKLVITPAAGEKCNPKSNEAFARFAAAAAQRYKGKSVRAWEIWNEPNLSSYWKTAQPPNNPVRNAVHADPLAYARLANAAAYQIRHSAPDTLVITGGLAPLWEPKYPKGYRQSDYLVKLLPHLEPTWFDAIGIHPYSWPTMPAKEIIHNAFYSVDQGREQFNLRAIMEKYGFGQKQLWGTEYGAPTKGVRAPGLSGPQKLRRPDHVSEVSQAKIIAQGIQHWYGKPNVGPLMVHSDSDQWLPQRKNEGGFGLRRQDGTKKPAYEAFRKTVNGLQLK
jgi:hypothetical protein